MINQINSTWKVFGDQIAEFFGHQILWLLIWTGAMLSLIKVNLYLFIFLFISGCCKFYLEVKKEYLKNEKSQNS